MICTTCELAERASISIRQVNYWHRLGIIEAAFTTPKGYARWGDEALRRARLFRSLLSLGMPRSVLMRRWDEIAESLTPFEPEGPSIGATGDQGVTQGVATNSPG